MEKNKHKNLKIYLIIAIIVLAIIFILILTIYNPKIIQIDNSKETYGVTDSEILIGSSAALTGHAGFLGSQTLIGSKAYINYVNENGGIHGRKIILISYDDKYHPPKTIKNTQTLIQTDKVFALFDYVGTPTSVKIIDIVNQAEIPTIGFFTGAQELREPFRPYIFNIRDSYYAEAEGAISYYVDTLGLKNISVFYQNDAFGLNVLKGTQLALQKRGLKTIKTATYKRGSLDIERAVESIKSSDPEALIMVGTYAPLAKFVKLSSDKNFTPKFHTVSFVGSNAYANELINTQNISTDLYDDIIVTQVVPSPDSKEFKLIQEYSDLMRKYYPSEELNYVSLEGFINAKILVKGLEKSEQNLTRTNFISNLESITNLDIGIGKNIDYSNSEHSGLEGIYYSKLSSNGKFELFNK
jgi:branched-chain amino acid transport system substrate-binding protein